MTEATIVAGIKSGLTKQLHGAVIFKINDLSTTGIPDLAVSYKGHTTWVEVKYLRHGETRSQFLKHFKKLQLATACLLERQVRTYYFIAYAEGMEAVVVGPELLAQYLSHDEQDVLALRGECNCCFDAAVNQLVWLVRRT